MIWGLWGHLMRTSVSFLPAREGVEEGEAVFGEEKVG
jgi:hypothetical protein